MLRVLSLSAAVLVLAAPAWAADPAAIDRSYDGGTVQASVAGPGALTPDGRAVFAGDGVVLERLGRDGRPDPAFGAGGRTAALVPGLQPRLVAAIADGSVIVVGGPDEAVRVVRVRPDGTLRDVVELGALGPLATVAAGDDGSAYVGHGDAVARVDAAGAATPVWARAKGPVDEISLAGTEVVVATDRYAGSGPMGEGNYEADLARFAADGRLLAERTVTGHTTALLARPQGALLSTSECFSHTFIPCDAFGFTRFDAAWKRLGGILADDEDATATELALEPDGDVLAAGAAEDRYGRSSSFYVRRYRGDRRLDRTFGRCGGAATPVPEGAAVSDLAVQPSGRIVGLLTSGLFSEVPRPGGAVALRGGEGRPRVGRPFAAARTAAEDNEPYDGGRSFSITVASDVPARVKVRFVLTRKLSPEGGEQLLTPALFRSEGLPRVGATGAGAVGGCEANGSFRVRLSRRMYRWLRTAPDDTMVEGRLEVVARNRAGVARTTGRHSLGAWAA